jgi:hypothetical protein
VFGSVQVVYSDFVGHGYHGISIIRNYIGFSVPVTRVIGLSQTYPVQNHIYRFNEWRDEETWQFGVLEFANGSRGVLNFSTLSYGSPLRWGREKCSVRFLAERGMGHRQDLAILADNTYTRPIKVQTRMISVRGQPTLDAFVSDLPDQIAWENPLRIYPLAMGDQHSPLTIGLQLLSIYKAITEGKEPEYPLHQAYYDRQIDLSITSSWTRNGEFISIKNFTDANTNA